MEEENKELLVLEKNTNSIENTANSIVITNQETYENAVKFAKTIKEANKKVTEYWKPSKESAALAHKTICQKEKDMLEPLKKAETILKSKMIEYTTEQEKIRQEEEIRLREEQEKLALEQLQKSEELKQQGNVVEASITEQNAFAISEINTKVESTVKKVDGMAYQTDYVIEITDATKVPNYINGIEIRPIDTSAIKKLVKMTSNTVEIPGVVIKETKIAKIRV